MQFQVAQDIGFERIVLDRTVDAAQGLLPDPSPGTYYLRVRRLDADGFAGNFGAPQSVDVPHLRWWWLLPLAPLLILL